jgi:tRNA1(Val) A37 N6-methylase TrmN6
MAAPGGTATLIHKADALGKVIGALSGRFGGLRILPIYPRAEAPAIRVIVQGIKGSRAPLTLLPGLILHGEGNAFTPLADAIFRSGAALTLEPKK